MFDVSAEPVFHHDLMSEISGMTVEGRGRELVVRYQTDIHSHFFILLLVILCMLNLPQKVLTAYLALKKRNLLPYNNFLSWITLNTMYFKQCLSDI